MGLSVEEVVTAGILGALHELGSLIVVAPTEAESLRTAESRLMLAKARFRLATIDVLTAFPELIKYVSFVARSTRTRSRRRSRES